MRVVEATRSAWRAAVGSEGPAKLLPGALAELLEPRGPGQQVPDVRGLRRRQLALEGSDRRATGSVIWGCRRAWPWNRGRGGSGAAIKCTRCPCRITEVPHIHRSCQLTDSCFGT